LLAVTGNTTPTLILHPPNSAPRKDHPLVYHDEHGDAQTAIPSHPVVDMPSHPSSPFQAVYTFGASFGFLLCPRENRKVKRENKTSGSEKNHMAPLKVNHHLIRVFFWARPENHVSSFGWTEKSNRPSH